MDIQVVGHRGDKPKSQAALTRSDSRLFYDAIERMFRADDTAVLRLDPEGRHPASIRQAMRVRGIYVTISARSDDRPYVTVTLDDLEGRTAIDPKIAQGPAVTHLTETEGWKLLEENGIDPNTVFPGGPQT